MKVIVFMIKKAIYLFNKYGLTMLLLNIMVIARLGI